MGHVLFCGFKWTVFVRVRYAFSPLVDADSEDEEEKEPMMNEAFGQKPSSFVFLSLSSQPPVKLQFVMK